MKVLFFMQRPGHIRNYESTLRELARRGHTIHLAFSTIKPKRNEPPDIEQAERLAASCDQVTFDVAPARDPSDGWYGIVGLSRLLGDMGRFLHPRYRDAPLLRARAVKHASRAVAKGIRPAFLGAALASGLRLLAARPSRVLSWLLQRMARGVEAATPASDRILDYIRRRQPDVVLATPVVELGSEQPEYLKAAQALGIPTGLCVASWDNLTNKGVLRIDPDRVFVWNEIQRDEAASMHGVEADSVVVTGAPRFDEWFERKPSRAPEAFRREVGLPADRPYVLYLCSSPFIAPDEVSFVREWLAALRSCPMPEVRSLGVLVRPHPQNAAQWADVDLDDPAVSIWPRAGAQVVDSDSKADFYDSIAHCAAVVGVNTTALIEASILGKDVLTVLAPAFAGTQLGTLHYHYLRRANGGFLDEASSLEEHLLQLRAVVAPETGERAGEDARRFVSMFVRPRGLDLPATLILADGIEELAGLEPPRRRRTPGAVALAAALTPLALLLRATARPRRRPLPPPPPEPARASNRKRVSVRRRLAQALSRNEYTRRIGRKLLDVLEGEPSRRAGIGTSEAETSKRASARIRTLLESSENELVLGPWTSDVQTEALVWLPFLRWVRDRFDVERDRLVAVSGGGVSAWYGDVAARYVDAAETQTDEPVRIDARAAQALRPAVMEELFSGYWDGSFSIRFLADRMRFDRLPRPAHPVCDGLPESFAVLAFAETPAFPASAASRDAIASLADRIPAKQRVVALAHPGSSFQEVLGEHASARGTAIELPADRASLAARSAIVGGARAILAPFGSAEVALGVAHGVPTFALYADPAQVDSRWVCLMQHAARELGSEFALIHVSQIELVASLGSRSGRLRALEARV